MIDTATLTPPSPDAGGLAYLPVRNQLLMTDANVEETVEGVTHFAGVNVWQLTLSGSVVATANLSTQAPTVVPMTDEPTDIAFRRSDGHYFLSDDDKRRVFELDPGADRTIGTADDTWTSFTVPGDPEGITYDSDGNRLFVVDGDNAEVYEYTPDGTLVGHFDVFRYGVADPEAIEYNHNRGTLFVLSNRIVRSNRTSGPFIVETTTAGELLRTIDVSASGVVKPAGLAYAPASNGSGEMRFYITDRGVRPDADPTAVDGKLYEVTAPSPDRPARP